MLFHVAIKVLATDTLCQDQEFIEFAKKLLVLFVRQCKEYYGEKFMSYNVHSLIHLADDVSKFGPLDHFSAFPFENHLQSIKKLLRKHDKPLPQVIRRIQEIQINSLLVNKKENGLTILKKAHTNGPVLDRCNGKQFKYVTYKRWILKTDNRADCYVILNDGNVVEINNLVQNSSGIYIIGKQFTAKSDLFCLPLQSTRLGIFSVQRRFSSPYRSWPISLIKSKALLIPTELNGNAKFAVFPLKMNQH